MAMSLANTVAELEQVQKQVVDDLQRMNEYLSLEMKPTETPFEAPMPRPVSLSLGPWRVIQWQPPEACSEAELRQFFADKAKEARDGTTMRQLIVDRFKEALVSYRARQHPACALHKAAGYLS